MTVWAKSALSRRPLGQHRSEKAHGNSGLLQRSGGSLVEHE
jgi:hypothetical protein